MAYMQKAWSGNHGEKKRKVTPGEKAKPKFRLSVGTLTDGTKEYFKIDSGGNKTTDSATVTPSFVMTGRPLASS